MPGKDEDMMEVEDVPEEKPKISYKSKLQSGAPQIAGLGPDTAPLKPQGKQPPKKEAAKASSSSAPSEPVPQNRWQVIYPIYINATRTLAEGRRIPKSKAVDNPTLQEMADSCTFLKIPVLPEPDKAFPRDYLWSPDRGRIRVQLRDNSGAPLNPDIPNKMALMLRLGALIPKHHGRTRKDVKETKKEQPEKEKEKKGKSGKKRK